MLASPALAKEMTAKWTYPTEFAQYVASWNFFYSIDESGGPYTAWVQVPYADGGPDYTMKHDLPLLPGTHTYYFVGVVRTVGGQTSADSNEAEWTGTLEIPPMTNFSVTITE